MVEDKGELTVKVRADGLPKPKIQWLLNGKPVLEDINHKIETHGEAQVTSDLTISNYSDDDIGIVRFL